MFIRVFGLLSVAILLACAKPSTESTLIPLESVSAAKAKVAFQPPPPPYPKAFPGKPTAGRVSVRLIISKQGRVAQIQPIEGEEPFLSVVSQYAMGWRFDSSDIEYRQAILTMVYTDGHTINLKIS